jgi:hypothetical protein
LMRYGACSRCSGIAPPAACINGSCRGG